MMARAALDAARVVFAPSCGPRRGAAADNATTSPEWMPLEPTWRSPRERGERLWEATVNVLQAATTRTELTGQALVGEARRRELLTLGDAHALIALYGWVEQLRDTAVAEVVTTPAVSGAETQVAARHSAPAASPSAAEREVAREAWMALEHAADRAVLRDAPPPFAPSRDEASRYAPPHNASNKPESPPPSAPLAMSSAASRAVAQAAPVGRKTHRRVGLIALALALVVCGVAAGGVWYARRGQDSADFRDGVAAYERGAREVARMSFARVAQRHPDDARPLVYLGRIAREDGDIARAKRFLESAVRTDPSSALANRELASTMLADGQPELARRFYVRALERDPDDRLAQGFLGCALLRLGRVEEARRWYDRAGVGDWTDCVPAPAAAPSP